MTALIILAVVAILAAVLALGFAVLHAMTFLTRPTSRRRRS